MQLASTDLGLPAVLAPGELPRLRAALDGVRVEESLLGYLHAIVEATRRAPQLAAGASPRAGIALLAAARAWAAMEGRDFAIPDDFKRMAHPVLRHRLIATPETELEGKGTEEILGTLLDRIEVPRG